MSNRKYFTPEQKVAIIRRHLLENVSVSDLCDELGIHATQYYTWQNQLFENGTVAYERRPNQANLRIQEDARENKIAQLKAKLQRKNEVVAELLEEHVQRKKRGHWVNLNGIWVPPDIRDSLVDHVTRWQERAEFSGRIFRQALVTRE